MLSVTAPCPKICIL